MRFFGENRLRTSPEGVCYLSPDVIRHVVLRYTFFFSCPLAVFHPSREMVPVISCGFCALHFLLFLVCFRYFFYVRWSFSSVPLPWFSVSFFLLSSPSSIIYFCGHPFPSCLSVFVFSPPALSLNNCKRGGGNTPTSVTCGVAPSLPAVFIRYSLPQP